MLFPPSPREREILNPKQTKREAREPQAWERGRARRDKLVSHFVDRSVLSGKNISACGALLPEQRMEVSWENSHVSLRVWGQEGCHLLSGSCECRPIAGAGWWGEVREGSWDSKMPFCHLED